MNELETKNPALRRTGAVFAGLLCVVVLSTGVDAVMHAAGVFPAVGQPMRTERWWLAIGYRAVFTVLGGWVSARADPSGSMRAVAILTGVGCILGLVGVGVAVNNPALGPAWYAWGVALTGPPCSWLGGTLNLRTHNR